MSVRSSIGNSLPFEVARVCREWEGCPASLEAHAKVNLRLKVEGRRPDGYHLLSMLNCSASLSDTLTITLLHEPLQSVVVEPQGVLSGVASDNSVIKAFRAFWGEFGFSIPPLGVECHIQKRIPIGGGLGGGSADAASIFRHLSGLFGSALKESFSLSNEEYDSRICRAALTCGADVPYAMVGGLCCVRGIGEVVLPVKHYAGSPKKVLLMVPRTPVPTAAFYDLYRKNRPVIQPIQDRILLDYVEHGERDLMSLVENDFEATACLVAPEIGEGLQLAREVFPRGSALTGSGSVFFSLIPDGGEGALSDLSSRLKSKGISSCLSSLIFL